LVSHFKGRKQAGACSRTERDENILVQAGRSNRGQEIIAQRAASGFVLLTIHHSANLKNRGRQGWNTWDKQARTERHAGFWWKKFKNKDSLNEY